MGGSPGPFEVVKHRTNLRSTRPCDHRIVHTVELHRQLLPLPQVQDGKALVVGFSNHHMHWSTGPGR